MLLGKGGTCTLATVVSRLTPLRDGQLLDQQQCTKNNNALNLGLLKAQARPSMLARGSASPNWAMTCSDLLRAQVERASIHSSGPGGGGGKRTRSGLEAVRRESLSEQGPGTKKRGSG